MATTLSRTYDTFATNTLDLLVNRFTRDQVFEANTFLKWLKSKGRYIGHQGGDFIRVNIRTAKSSAAGFYAPMQPLDLTPQQPDTSAFYKWAQCYAMITLSNDEFYRNRGPEQIYPILKTLNDQASLTLADQLSENIWAGSTSRDGTDGINIASMKTLVADDPTATGVGSIAASVTSFRNKYDASAYTFNTTNNPTSAEAALQDLINSCTFGSNSPDAIFSDQALYSAYQKAWMKRGQYLVPAAKGDSGAPDGMHFAQVPWYFDRKAGSQNDLNSNVANPRLYVLNSSSLKLHYLEGRDFSLDGPHTLPNVDARYWRIVWQGQLVQEERRLTGVLTTVTAS